MNVSCTVSFCISQGCDATLADAPVKVGSVIVVIALLSGAYTISRF